ncbi:MULTISPECIES: ZIP family metal transporter [Persicobacter]|uniref:ZIP family metal transporter n=1 Tax=Persicobacter diffluens TaxID=981 RepID=A0AAN4VX07_9BACT|nr:ZIP family metal transporter [Persicobacter sp. CCB-QB2]GJM59870.1 hypothetical protein PEDI_04220 [Persicobacter diffluens]
MWLTLSVLFFATLLAGLAQPWISKKFKPDFREILNFAGGYLFALTVVHQIPELFHFDAGHDHSLMDETLLGGLILMGFFVQVILEKLSGGIEHGHFHASGGHGHQDKLSPWVLLIGLGIHSILEGAMLGHGALSGHELSHGHYHGNNLLLGIMLHKLPAAFALTALLNHGKTMKNRTIVILLLFAAASPVGALMAHALGDASWVEDEHLRWISALVTGSFLHISSTIFFENTGKAHKSWKGFGAMLLGSLIAVSTEFFPF